MELFDFVLPGARANLGYAERLLKGIPVELSATRPVVNGKTVDCNHPVFLFGHLSLYPQLVASMTGIPKEGLEVPAHYPGLFQIGCPCQEDPKGEIYPPLAEVSERFFSGMKNLPAATVAEFAPGGGMIRQWRYWDLPEYFIVR